MKARIFIGVAFLFFGFSCQLNQNIIYNINDDNLYFDSDSTFTYFSDGPGCVKRYSSGILVRKGSEIDLNSYIIEKRFPVTFNMSKSHYRMDAIAVNVKLNSKENPSNDYTWIAFTNNAKKLYDPLDICFDSIVRFPNKFPEPGVKLYEAQGPRVFYITEPIDSLFFTIRRSPWDITYKDWSDYPVNTISMKLNCVLGDSINVNINIVDSLFSYVMFKEVALRKKHGSIILKYNNGYEYKLFKRRSNGVPKKAAK